MAHQLAKKANMTLPQQQKDTSQMVISMWIVSGRFNPPRTPVNGIYNADTRTVSVQTATVYAPSMIDLWIRHYIHHKIWEIYGADNIGVLLHRMLYGICDFWHVHYNHCYGDSIAVFSYYNNIYLPFGWCSHLQMSILASYVYIWASSISMEIGLWCPPAVESGNRLTFSWNIWYNYTLYWSRWVGLVGWNV